MRIIIVDDDLKQNHIICGEIIKQTRLNPEVFTDEKTAVLFIEKNRADIVFVSVCSENIDYLSVINTVKKCNAQTVVFIIGDDENQSLNVYKYRCDYFIKKPYDTVEIDNCIERFQLLSNRITHKVYVKTFGRFDVFINGVSLDFHNSKAKELFALCIDHYGGNVYMDEAIDKLWPDRIYDEKVKRLYRKAVMSINKVLTEKGILEIFSVSRGKCCIKRRLIECDYFKFIEDPVKNRALFQGEYLFDYSWAEGKLAQILNISNITCE